MWGINILWGILGTPVIDPETRRMYVVCWTSPDGTVAKAVYNLHEIDIADGSNVRGPVPVNAPPVPGSTAVFTASGQKQRPALLLTTKPAKTLFVAFSMTHENHNATHGWVIAFDVATNRVLAEIGRAHV